MVAAAFPNDSDGNAFRAVFPQILGRRVQPRPVLGLPGRADELHVDDHAVQAATADFFTNVPLPPDFATMWTQSLQQGFKPKLATVAKVLLFPTDAYAMGSKVYNIATDAWWVPELPWTSSLTGETCTELATPLRAAGLGQPNQNICNYTLFEIAYAALTAVDNPHDKAELAAALHKVKRQGGGRPARYLHQHQDEPRARRRDHAAGGHPVAEGHQVPAGDTRWSTTRCSRTRRSPATCCPPANDR